MLRGAFKNSLQDFQWVGAVGGKGDASAEFAWRERLLRLVHPYFTICLLLLSHANLSQEIPKQKPLGITGEDHRRSFTTRRRGFQGRAEAIHYSTLHCFYTRSKDTEHISLWVIGSLKNKP